MSIVRTLVTIIYQFLCPAKYEEEPFTFWCLTWYSALVGLVSSVGSDVLLEVGELGELALTDLTPVGLDAQVDPGVLGEVGAVGKSLATGRTLVRFWFPHVDLSVELEVCFGVKSLEVNSEDLVRRLGGRLRVREGGDMI